MNKNIKKIIIPIITLSFFFAIPLSILAEDQDCIPENYPEYQSVYCNDTCPNEHDAVQGGAAYCSVEDANAPVCCGILPENEGDYEDYVADCGTYCTEQCNYNCNTDELVSDCIIDCDPLNGGICTNGASLQADILSSIQNDFCPSEFNNYGAAEVDLCNQACSDACVSVPYSLCYDECTTANCGSELTNINDNTILAWVLSTFQEEIIGNTNTNTNAAKTITSETITITSPLSTSDPRAIIASIIGIALVFLGIATLTVIIISGGMMMFAGANEETFKKGRTWILWAIIGLALVLSSYAILEFIFTRLPG